MFLQAGITPPGIPFVKMSLVLDDIQYISSEYNDDGLSQACPRTRLQRPTLYNRNIIVFAPENDKLTHWPFK